MRSHLLIAMTALVILAIEWSRQLGTILPIPFLLLYASVVASGGMGGILAGGISGALATAFIGYAAMIGFGPPTLTGGELQAFLGMALYLGTGLLLGRVRDQRNRFERQTREHEASLQERIAQLTGQFAAILYNAPMAIFLKDRDGRFQFVNRRFAEWYGVAEQDAVGKTSHDIFPAEMADAYVAQDREVTETRAVLEREHEIVFADGSRHPIVVTKFPVLDATGDFIGIGTCNIDVTDRHLAEERLAQAQKMEAVGQLTGGVAHDFNNLLMIIQGNAELLAGRGGAALPLVRAIQRASERGAGLTQRLLAFSRRQPLSPQAIDLSELLAGMSDLLARSLGETIHVDTVRHDGLWNAMADPGQVETAILNLAINARDAMREGGKLTIECANVRIDRDYADRNPDVQAGEYVVLGVSDTGGGMSAAVRERAFEPFFTTKGLGEGSGLGLSMVYGFVKQSGGHTTIYSEEGQGTTVKIFLPRAEGAARPEEARRDDDAPRGRGERILVIEDDPDVRALAVVILEGLGYRVVDVGAAAAARDVLAGGAPVDVMLSDVVLPGGTSGPEFAEEARAARPDLKVIFMSGYPAEAAKRNSFLGSDQVLLNKPFVTRQLAKALRSALG